MSFSNTIDLTLDDDGIEVISSMDWGNPTSKTQVSSFNPPSSLNINLKEKRKSDVRIGPPTGKRRRIEPSPSSTRQGTASSSSSNPRSSTSSRSQSAAATHVGSSSTSRPTPTYQVIELSDEDEPPSAISRQAASHRSNSHASRPLPSRPHPSRPQKTLSSPSLFHRLQSPVLFDRHLVQRITSEEDYDHIHAGFDQDNADAWEPMKSNTHRVTMRIDETHDGGDSGSDSDSDPEETERLRILKKQRFRTSIVTPASANTRPPQHTSTAMDASKCWNLARLALGLKRVKRVRMGGECVRDALPRALGLDTLRLATSFKSCPGSIIRVEQRKGWVAVAGASIGGTPDLPRPDGAPPTVDPYNREGALCTYSRKRENPVNILLGHQANRAGEVNHYGVNDVRFCPVDDKAFVSSGNDHTVQIWKQSQTGRSHQSMKLHKFENVPLALAFKPGTSVLAVAAGSVFIFPELDPRRQPMNLGSVKENQIVGNICWGEDSTERYLFTSTEPKDQEVFIGRNVCFDATSGKPVYKFDAPEAGDALFLDPLGDTLAIATRLSNSNGILRLYDVRRKDGKYVGKVPLEPFKSGVEGEIHDASFSPDGNYIALGRHDNRTHVYDSRFLGRGVLYDFSHDNAALQVSPGYELCGVMKLQWVQSGERLGLVTSGSDGCVRLWDPLEAQRQKYGVVLAKVNSDIATFSLGDKRYEEHHLVVGDCTGEVSIFDRISGPNVHRIP